MTMLERLRDQYAAHRTAIEAVQTRVRTDGDREFTEDELTEIETRGAAATRLIPMIERQAHEDERRAAVDAAEAQAAGAAGGALGELAHRRVPDLLPSGAQLREMHEVALGRDAVQRRWEVAPHTRGGAGPLGSDETRAVTTLAVTGSPSVGLGAPSTREPRRLATAAGLTYQNVDGVSGTVFPVFGSADTADITAENATKPEYDDITSATATPAVIAIWSDVSRQVMMTLPSFEQRLRSKLAARVALREDVLLVARVLAASGIQTLQAATTSVPYADSLLTAAAMIMSSDVAASPNLAVINPADLVKILPSTSTGANGQSPISELRLDLHGLVLYPSTAVAAGAAIVGAWPEAASMVVGMPPTILIDSMSGLKQNRISVLLEEAVTLAVLDPKGFVSVDLNGP